MKKYLQVIISIAFILSLAVNIAVFAAEEQTKSVKFSEDGKLDFRSRAISEEEIERLHNADLFIEPSDQEIILNNKVIKKYLTYYWKYAGLSLAEICEKSNELNEFGHFNYYYIVLNEELSQFDYSTLDESHQWRFHKLEINKNPIPQYLTDIKNLNSVETFFDLQCSIEDIVCFDMNVFYRGIVVYLKTDRGNFVKYYEWPKSEAVLYTEEEFQPFAADYYQYLTDPKNNYSADGKVLMRSELSFKEFLERKQQGTLASPQVSSRSKTVKICLGAAGGVILLAGGIIGIVVIRRRKRSA